MPKVTVEIDLLDNLSYPAHKFSDDLEKAIRELYRQYTFTLDSIKISWIKERNQ